jgi:transposase
MVNQNFPKVFVRTLKQDLSAVESPVSKPWSNGPVEGHINRLKNAEATILSTNEVQ